MSNASKLRFVRLDQENFSENGLELTFAASFSETYNKSGRATVHPLEDGGSVSDHFITDPDTFSIEAAFSDNPVTVRDVINGQNIFGEGTAAGLYQTLESIYQAGEIFRLVTGRRVVERCIIETISSPRDKGTKGTYFVSLGIKEMRFAESDEATFKFKPIKKEAPKARETVDKGNKSTTKATEAQSESRLFYTGPFNNDDPSCPPRFPVSFVQATN